MYSRLVTRINARHQVEIAAAAELRTGLRRFLRRTEEAASAYRLTPQRYDLLLQVQAASEIGDVTIGQLAERLALRQPAVSELVKRAEQAGLVERRGDSEDGRVVRLRLTAEGSRRLLGTFSALRADRESFRELIAHLPPSINATRSDQHRHT
jgi:DNA-binding MarR family transcriptional regulator